jgi:hypothetical protein
MMSCAAFRVLFYYGFKKKKKKKKLPKLPKSTIDSGERVPPGSAARDVGQLVDRCKLHYCTAAASSAHDFGTQ